MSPSYERAGSPYNVGRKRGNGAVCGVEDGRLAVDAADWGALREWLLERSCQRLRAKLVYGNCRLLEPMEEVRRGWRFHGRPAGRGVTYEATIALALLRLDEEGVAADLGRSNLIFPRVPSA